MTEESIAVMLKSLEDMLRFCLELQKMRGVERVGDVQSMLQTPNKKPN